MSSTRFFIPSLYGLRAISILLVIFGHLIGTRDSPLPDVRPFFGDVANLGVLVFFVISGYLITTILMREQERTGSISLLRFYARRTIRIFPAAYTYLLVVGLLTVYGAVQVPFLDLAGAGVYVTNLAGKPHKLVSHFWSLAVEEQFYLLWPFAVAYCRPQSAKRTAWIFVGIGFVCRFFVTLLGWRWTIFPAVADALAFGSLLALYSEQIRSYTWYKRFLSSGWTLPVLLGAIWTLNAWRTEHSMAYSSLLISAMLAAITLVVEKSMQWRTGMWFRVLNSPPLVFIGTISYSLYLWQQLFTDPNSSRWFTRFPGNVVLTFAAALISWFLLERSLQSWRDRFLPRSGMLQRVWRVAA